MKHIVKYLSKTDNSILFVLIASSEILTKYGKNKDKKTNSPQCILA